MQSFDQIYVLDLHGNSLKKERCPDGSKDENVFDIQQGVAIGLFIKKAGLKRKVCHADLWGFREEKYGWLEKNDISTVQSEEIQPKSPSYFFMPRDEAFLERYEKFSKITEVFPLNGVGMTTARDNFVMDFDKSILLNRIRQFKHSKFDDNDLHAAFEIRKKKGWSIRKAWKMLQEMTDSQLEDYVLPVLYRPFDSRWIFYHDALVWRTVKRVMRHLVRGNLGLITTRQFKEKAGAFIARTIMTHKTVSAYDINYLFPLYCYSETGKNDLLSDLNRQGEKKPNLGPSPFQLLKSVYGRQIDPEDVFYYIYAVLYSPTYRTKYAEFLKTDFPRVAFTKDQRLFKKLADLGKKLVDLHLLKSSALAKPICRFQGKENNRVEKQNYNPKERRVYINKAQYFEGVEPEVWKYQIGGYQVLDKWLKDRKTRILNTEDIKHYCGVVTALANTIEIQREIDELYPEVEKDVVSI